MAGLDMAAPSAGLWNPHRTRLLIVAAALTTTVMSVWAYASTIASGQAGFDTHTYWAVNHHTSLYGLPAGQTGAYLYSPAFAQAFWPLSHLPWPIVGIGWALGVTALFAWLLAPLGRWWLILPLLGACTEEIVVGNVFALLAVVAVVGFARPELWAFAALTKVTPCLGPVWFAARGEWRPFRRTIIATLIIVALSVLVGGAGAWLDWIRFLAGSHSAAVGGAGPAGMPGVALRLPIAIALTVWGARTGRRWLLPIAMLFAFPVLWGSALTVLAAMPRLRGKAPLLRPDSD